MTSLVLVEKLVIVVLTWVSGVLYVCPRSILQKHAFRSVKVNCEGKTCVKWVSSYDKHAVKVQ